MSSFASSFIYSFIVATPVFGVSLHHRCADFREGEEQATGDALVRAIGDATAKSRFILGCGQSAAATRKDMSE